MLGETINAVIAAHYTFIKNLFSKDTLKAFGNVIVALHNEFEGIFFIYFKFTPVFF